MYSLLQVWKEELESALSDTEPEPESQNESLNTDSERSNGSTSSEYDTGEMGSSYRKKRRISRYNSFVSGAARIVYKV